MGSKVINILVMVIILSSCSLRLQELSSPYGKIRYKETGKFAPDVMIVMRWVRTKSNGIEICTRVENRITDRVGDFRLPELKQIIEFDAWKANEYNLVIHKEGYVYLPIIYDFENPNNGSPEDDIYMHKQLVTKTTYMKSLLEKAKDAECYFDGREDEAQPVVVSLYKELYEEARSIAEKLEQKELVDQLHYYYDRAKYGRHIADDMRYKREKKSFGPNGKWKRIIKPGL